MQDTLSEEVKNRMISDGLFSTQLETIAVILGKANLLEVRANNPNKSLGASDFRGLGYKEAYEKYLQNFAYDFLLKDQSFFLFIKAGNNAQNGSLSFSYYEAPVSVLNYEQFLASEFGVALDGPEQESILEEYGDGFRDQYEQYIGTSMLKSVVTPLRYDYCAAQYRQGIHPASHMHFGFANNVRIGTRNVLNPLSFVLLILRQHYPRQYEQLRSDSNFLFWTRNVRSNLNAVHSDYWNLVDEGENYLL